VVAAKSSGPRTVVSKNATYKNAINLSQVNLIGVYGSQANRYALIRQSNGRFKKVYVGDRFDGGLVAAITENELRYSKGGQMVALQMPKG
jgi:expansin (peptidoglycan-binding protein)